MGTGDAGSDELTELYSETRILLPGTQVFLGFLVTLPFTDRFRVLTDELRLAYVTTFFCTLAAATLFLTPAAYHRFARPIQHKHAFKLLANTLILAGLLPLSVSVVLVTYLVTSMVLPDVAGVSSAVVGIVVLVLWWVLPVTRVHERYLASGEAPPPEDGRGGGLTAGARRVKDEVACSPTRSASSSTTS